MLHIVLTHLILSSSPCCRWDLWNSGELHALPQITQLLGDRGLVSRFYDQRGDEVLEQVKVIRATKVTQVQHLLTGSLTPFHGGNTQPLPFTHSWALLPLTSASHCSHLRNHESSSYIKCRTSVTQPEDRTVLKKWSIQTLHPNGGRKRGTDSGGISPVAHWFGSFGES